MIRQFGQLKMSIEIGIIVKQPVTTYLHCSVWDQVAELSLPIKRLGAPPRVAAMLRRAIGKMFYKTKLCCKFRAGVCPYVTNCNFAHGLEELRKPPPNWQEIVAAHEEERGVTVEQREEHQIPTISTSELRNESPRTYKGRHCKKFYTEEGCPYGENCTFLHDEQSRARESVAISVNPTVGGGTAYGANGPTQKPSNWKTRICNKWETTGSCPFGSKCHFAHGLAELHKFSGLDGEGRDSPMPAETKPSGMTTKTDTLTSPNLLTLPRQEYHHVGIPSQRSSSVPQAVGQRAAHKWKGPDKISRIYGDWIDDIE
ncbi:hypothetical protein SOVF_107930 [Spinacia oleracea]|nr:hypothetical protein SOVF_107930 [Spinacia oleracea]